MTGTAAGPVLLAVDDEAVAGWGAKCPDVTVQRRAIHDPDIVRASDRPPGADCWLSAPAITR